MFDASCNMFIIRTSGIVLISLEEVHIDHFPVTQMHAHPHSLIPDICMLQCCTSFPLSS